MPFSIISHAVPSGSQVARVAEVVVDGRSCIYPRHLTELVMEYASSGSSVSQLRVDGGVKGRHFIVVEGVDAAAIRRILGDRAQPQQLPLITREGLALLSRGSARKSRREAVLGLMASLAGAGLASGISAPDPMPQSPPVAAVHVAPAPSPVPVEPEAPAFEAYQPPAREATRAAPPSEGPGPVYQLVSVSFHGDTLEALKDGEGRLWGAIGRACEALGIDTQAQTRRLTDQERQPSWAVGRVAMMATPSRGGSQQTLMLEIRAWPMWLATIQPSRTAAPGLKEKLGRYQIEAADHLARIFIDQVASGPAPAHADPIMASLDAAMDTRRLQLEQGKQLAEVNARVARVESAQQTMQEHDTQVVQQLLRMGSTASPGTTSSSDLATQCGWWSYSDGQGKPHRNAVIDAARAAGMDHAKLMETSVDGSYERYNPAKRFTAAGVRMFRREVAPKHDGGEHGPRYFTIPSVGGHSVHHVYHGCPDSPEQAKEWQRAAKIGQR